MTEFSFRMDREGMKPFYETDQSGLAPSTATQPTLSQVTSTSNLAVLTDNPSQSGVSNDKTFSQTLMYRFSGMQIVAKSLTSATTDGGEDEAVAKQHMTLQQAEQLLRGKNQVPLQGIEFLRYSARKPRVWCYRVYKRSSGKLIGLQSWRSSPEDLVQDFKKESDPELIAGATCIWHHLARMKEGDWKSSASFEEFYRNHTDEGSYRRKRQRIH
ncbi:hypothetical protein HD553DRAFT_342649 [Filobasidium floriforme]|uniref:uncharacterized protein n=1 Tax=Filobasidium floriforme TaxID=5210 RepID=UPI001E8EB280|nr:uncharacterized protein HD553DRAFT_342649 [Filobasidium floriforme]KAH8084248.1 hypothetical protein HD553DRAFT_342649 [Filobasidium floriforme]